MTQQKQLKQLVRDRMRRTGQRYAAARRAVLHDHVPKSTPHRPGSIPGATVLRVLLAHAGRELSEAMVFGLAGGIGIGTFTFCYEKENFASFYVASRHCWHDHALYLTRACRRLGLEPVVKESTTPKAAEKQLRDSLAQFGPCVAWVEMNALPHRGLPRNSAGNTYHLISVYSTSATTALVGDLSDQPIEMPLAELTNARGLIKKDRYRLLAVSSAQRPGELASLATNAMSSCRAGLDGRDGPKNFRKNFSLDGLAIWADRLVSSKDPNRWERVFPPGSRMWTGLLFMHLFIEYFSTGGGLSRPMMGAFLESLGSGLKNRSYKQLARQYAELGEQWSELADAALPDSVREFKEAKRALATYAELCNSEGSVPEKKACWHRLNELRLEVSARFPLTAAECHELRQGLAERVRAIHANEVAAQLCLNQP